VAAEKVVAAKSPAKKVISKKVMPAAKTAPAEKTANLPTATTSMVNQADSD
jgi:hypothetical protein